ncbi:MAG: hypothetical protein KDA61_14325, partial [Planctomycetales bacterium]|nr:hypothetical protein [Planctomycetales bacterium]
PPNAASGVVLYQGTEYRAPFSLALVNLFVDLSERGVDSFPTPALRVNPWQNFKNNEADIASYLHQIGRDLLFQPDAGQGGDPSGYKAYSFYNLAPANGESNEDLIMPWSVSLALLSGIPEAEQALRMQLAADLHGPFGLVDMARWQTDAAEPNAATAFQDYWNSTLSLMALMRYVDGVDSASRLLADLPAMSQALDRVFYRRRAGDFFLDNQIDARDLAVWESLLGLESGDLSADANGDRLTDGFDFLEWQRQRGVGVAGNAVQTAAPEPAAATLAATALAALLVARRRSLT